MSTHKRIDMSEAASGKRAAAAEQRDASHTPSEVDKPKRIRAVAMLASFVVLAGAVTWVYWDTVFPPKVPQEDIGPAAIPDPENQPPQPGQPRTPEQQRNPNLPKDIVPG